MKDQLASRKEKWEASGKSLNAENPKMSKNDLLIDFRQFSVKVKLNWRDLIKYNVKKDDKPKKRQDNISYKIKKNIEQWFVGKNIVNTILKNNYFSNAK